MDYSAALQTATQAALAAGRLLREEFHRPEGPRGEIGHAPADEEAERVIRRLLHDAFPDWSYLGEETGAQLGRDPSHCWLVDPNDGTALFQKGHRGSAVSIGLLRDCVPVLGVVYAFCAPDDRGDLFTWAEGAGPVRRNGNEVHASFPAELDAHSIVLLAPGAEAFSRANLEAISPARFRALPSIAYRLALAAAGEGVAAASLHSPGAWDYGGGHALIRGAGGEFVNEEGRPVTYAVSGESRTLRCFGGGSRVVRELARRDVEKIRNASREPRVQYDLVRLKPGRNISDPGLLSRGHGCLLGQLAGDSLGSLVEFQSPAEIERRYPGGLRALADGGTFGTIAGQPTDDSEMALMLARSLLQAGRYDASAASTAYVYWYDSSPFDCGNTVARALEWQAHFGTSDPSAREAEKRGAPASESQANGALMRVSPLGIWGHSSPPEQLAESARSDARLTHPNVVCQEANAVYAVAVARAIATGGTPQDVYGYAVEWAARNCRAEAVTHALAQAATRAPDNSRNHGWVLIALQNAFYQLLHSGSFEKGVVNSVMVGGDTDTNAAIAGALLGAVHGRDAMPPQWRGMVLTCRPIAGRPNIRCPRPRDFWPVDAMALAERLLLNE